MSKFSKALEQAQRDRALGVRPAPAPAENGHSDASPPPAPRPPKPVTSRRRPVGPTSAVDDHLVSLIAPASLEAEQYRALRHVVEQKRRTDNMSVIAISSPAGGDGKTTTAINLAGALAQARDARVLLVEADLRNPAVASLLGFSDTGAAGLVHAILDPGLSLAQIVHPVSTFNLGVVVAGQTPPSPYEVLKSPRLGALLEEARREYDFVIVDTPPLLPVQDYRVISRFVDGLVLVVAAHRTPRAMLAAAFDIIDPARMIGLVFNGYDHLLAGSHMRYHGRYYPLRSGAGRTSRKTGARLGGLLRGPSRRPAGGRRTEEDA